MLYDQRRSPALINSTGRWLPSAIRISVPAGWQSQLQPVVAMLKIFDPGRKCETGFFSIGSTWPVITRPYTYNQSLPSCTPRMPHRPTWPSPILQYRAHAVHMILFVPSTGFQSSATLPIALPGGSRTSRTSFSEIIVLGTLPVSEQNTLGSGYRITDE